MAEKVVDAIANSLYNLGFTSLPDGDNYNRYFVKALDDCFVAVIYDEFGKCDKYEVFSNKSKKNVLVVYEGHNDAIEIIANRIISILGKFISELRRK